MNKNLNKLRDKCTDKQAKFTQLIHQGVERAKAYKDAGFGPKNRRIAIQTASRLLTTNTKVIAYLEALKANDDRNTNISRGMQLNKLNTVYKIAEAQNNPSAMTSAIREQNEMLGYHREQAPNLEREQARKDIVEQERRELERLADKRDQELSQPALKLAKGAG